LRRDSAIVQPAAALATAKVDFPAAVVRRAREMESRQVVAAAAVSFAARSWPGLGPFAVALFSRCRCLIASTAALVPAAAAAAAAVVVDPFDLAGSGFAAAVVVVAVAVDPDSAVVAVGVVVVAAGLSAVVVDPDSDSAGSSSSALVCSVYFFAA